LSRLIDQQESIDAEDGRMHPSRAFTRLLVLALALQTVLHAHTVALGSSLPPVMDSIARKFAQIGLAEALSHRD
jgi:hypothetical protein